MKKNTKIYLAVGVILLIVGLVYGYKYFIYRSALTAISQARWSDAKNYLDSVPNNWDSKTLQRYISANEFLQQENGRLKDENAVQQGTLGYLDDIPENYNGDLANEIREFRDNLKKMISESSTVAFNVQLIKDKKYEVAESNLISNKDDEESQVLYNYASALENEQASKTSMVVEYLKDIPPTYSGALSKEIQAKVQQYKSEIKSAEQDEVARQQQQALLNSIKPDPKIGMTTDEVLNSSWGKPSDINKTTTQYGVSEQWVYGGGRYLYFDDGIVTAIQD